jgi:peptidoglycan hydrolase FlgJ
MLNIATPSFADVAGLQRLRSDAAREDPKAIEEAATQFEGLVIGMMLKSAREATGEGVFDGPETGQYLELMDQQVALEMARKGGFGLGKWLAAGLKGQSAHSAPEPEALVRDLLVPRTSAAAQTPPALNPLASVEPAPVSDAVLEPRTPDAFVSAVLPHARRAARRLGVAPDLLVAQAALETGWGRAVPKFPDGRPTNNLFGIKADAAWSGEKVAQPTLEYVNGVAERRSEQFRAYPDLAASFDDYARHIAANPRYQSALARGGDAESYVRAVSAAGYATDPDYGDKWLGVWNGSTLRAALDSPRSAPRLNDTLSTAAADGSRQ